MLVWLVFDILGEKKSGCGRKKRRVQNGAEMLPHVPDESKQKNNRTPTRAFPGGARIKYKEMVRAVSEEGT